MLELLFGPSASLAARRFDAGLAMDAFVREDTAFLVFDLPGVPAQDVQVRVEPGLVRVQAERRMTPDPTDKVLRSERNYGEFVREVRLGDGLDVAAARADLVDGVLTVSIPLRPSAVARSLEINTGSKQQQLLEAPGV